MAGGEGTRLRPLTSNQPKPMVPIVGKPCMEHIIELLRAHDFEDVIVTVAFMPQAIRSYFGDGESLGARIAYSVEESPLGTAGSVRLATDKLDDTFLVISGDALCDFDLTKLVMGRGYDFSVNLAGKIATWLLYASLAFVMVTREGTDWPLWIFWAGVVLAAISLSGYLLKARREVRT